MTDHQGISPGNTTTRMLASLGVALAIWLFSAFNEEYTYPIKARIQYHLPYSVELTDSLEKEVILKVHGTGWSLLRISAAQHDIDLHWDDLKGRSVVEIKDHLEHVVESMPDNVTVEDVSPAFMPIHFVEVDSIKVPVSLRLSEESIAIDFIDSIKIEPDSVWVKGPKNDLNRIDSWQSETITFNGGKLKATVPLTESDTFHTSAVAVNYFLMILEENNPNN